MISLFLQKDTNDQMWETKGQLVNLRINFSWLRILQKSQRKFLQISAPASEMGQIRKIQILYCIKYTLITN